MTSAVETTALDRFIARFFAAFDNRSGRVPTRAELDALFLESAVILQHTAGKTAIMTVAGFADPRVALLTSGRLKDFSEWETSHTTELHPQFAIRTSQYAKSGMMDSKPYAGRGIKLFQLAKINDEWRIASLCWYDSEA